MSLKQKWDLIIVGSGAIGTFHALFAASKGLRVLVLEKDLRPTEATVRNFGQIIPSGMTSGDWFEYGKISLETYKSIQQEFDISVRQNGSTYLASTPEEFAVLTEKAAEYNSFHYPCTLLHASECLSRFPAIKKEYCVGGLHFAQEINVEPDYMIHRLHEYMIAKYDVDYRPSTPVRECFVKDGQVVVIDSWGHHYHASKLFICSGRDFKFLMPDIFSNSDLELVKLQMMSTYPLPELKLPGSILSGLSIKRYSGFHSCPSYHSIKDSALPAGIKKWGIHILFKQAKDGSIIIGDSHDYADVSTSDTIDYANDDEINQLIISQAKLILNLPSWKIKLNWNGYYSQSKSKEIFHKIVDSRIHIITGIGGKGMTTSCGFAKTNVDRIFA